MKDIALVGAGGLGRETLVLVHHINQLKKEWHMVGFFDDGLERGYEIDRHKVLGGLDDLNEWENELSIIVAIADPHIKCRVKSCISNPLIVYPALIHPSSIYGSFQNLGDGSVVAANCSLTTNIRIGSHVIINLNCTVGHDSIIEDYCSIMPGSNISGNVTIRKATYIGTGVQILPGVTIEENVIVGAGAVVTRDISSDQVVAGVPAKRIK